MGWLVALDLAERSTLFRETMTKSKTNDRKPVILKLTCPFLSLVFNLNRMSAFFSRIAQSLFPFPMSSGYSAWSGNRTILRTVIVAGQPLFREILVPICCGRKHLASQVINGPTWKRLLYRRYKRSDVSLCNGVTSSALILCGSEFVCGRLK